MNKEIIVETLKDAMAQLGLANELMAELTSKEKVSAHIEMAKAYALAGIAAALSDDTQAPETVAETKLQKTETKAKTTKESTKTAKTTKAVEPKVVEAVIEDDDLPFADPAQETELTPEQQAELDHNEDMLAESNLGVDPSITQDEPLVTIIEDTWIQFNRPVVEDDFDYSAWFMEYVNAVDEEGNPIVGAQWANDYMSLFTSGECTTIECLNDNNVMQFMEFVIDAISKANPDA